MNGQTAIRFLNQSLLFGVRFTSHLLFHGVHRAMLTGLLALTFLSSMPALVLGLINPRLVLPWGKEPTRMHAVQLYGTSLIGSIVLLGAIAPSPSPSTATPPVASAPAPSPPVTNTPGANMPVASVPVASAAVASPPSAPMAIAQSSLPTVVSVKDGDTVTIANAGRTQTIRLACIDAPEGDQPGGTGATMRLKSYLPVGQTVTVRTVDTDRYGRTVAELYLAGESLNLKLVQEGWAFVYPQYLDGCADTRTQLIQAEQLAQANRFGAWNQPNVVMPWDWRRGVRSPQSQPAMTPPVYPTPATPAPITPPPSASPAIAAPPTNAFPACVQSDCDCSDFSSQAEAQRVLAAFPGDPFKLDRDRDGIACESLR